MTTTLAGRFESFLLQKGNVEASFCEIDDIINFHVDVLKAL